VAYVSDELTPNTFDLYLGSTTTLPPSAPADSSNVMPPENNVAGFRIGWSRATDERRPSVAYFRL